MTIREILSVAESHGIKLRLDGDDVLFRAPPGALTPELRRLLRQRKAELIEFLRADAGAAPPRIPRGPDPSSGPGPLSAGQRRLWFLDHLAPGSAVYNVHFGLRVQGPLDAAALRASLTAIVSHHPMLRASFPEQDGRPSVVVAPSREWELPFVDLRDVAGKESELGRISKDHAAAPYDLARGPLLRTLLVALEHEEHVLLVGQHHIVTDATSLGLFVRDLLTCYRALASGRPIELVEPPVRYLDYARWQDEWLRSEPAKSMEAWWKRRLAGVPRLELPVSRTPPPVRTQEGAAHSFSIPADLTSAVKDLGRPQGCTLFVTLLSAWAAVLHRYSQQSDFAVGTVTAGRDRAELAELIGFFVNTLPLRCDFSGDPDAATVMQRLRKEVQEALEHQDLPFDRIVNAAGADRGNDLNPLFRASFSLQGVPIQTAAGPDLRWRITLDTPDGAVADVAKFEVGLTMVETPDGLWATLQYARDLFDRSTIERMAEHYRTLLEGMVANPRSPICRLPLLTECERDALLAPAVVSRGGCIHEWFEEQAERRPGSIAVVCEAEQLTYRELDERANRLAHHLRACGAGLEVPVALLLDRSVATAVAILGVLKAGCAYVPIEPGNPAERIAFLLADTGAPVLVTQARYAEKARGYTGTIVRLDGDRGAIERQPASKPISQTTSESCAYVIYTSGSTGNPKGVRVSHGNVVRLFAATEEWFHFDEHDVWTLFHSYAFDVSVWELWGALFYGGQVVIVPYDVSRSPQAFHALLVRERVTVLSQTPSAFRLLVDADAQAKAAELSLRLVIFAGEAIDLPSLRPWFERHGDERPQLVNMYGITETTVHVTYRPLRASDLTGSPSPIGRPIPDLQVYVLDRNRQLLPIGVPGELYVGGAGVALGYLNRPELTAERFIADPFTPGARLYRTGDLGQWLEDGTLEYLGRCDQQVKIRGFRIELGEIESVLQEHGEVREAVVVAREDQRGDKRLVAYVVPRTKRGIAGELRSHLQRRLPDYMIPTALVELAAIPLTVNGKVDRKALPPPGDARPELGREYAPARSIEEELLAGIWAEVLGLERVGIDDNFFELGGDSILSIQVVARAQRAGVDLSVRSMFKHQTIRELAEAVAAGGQLDEESSPLEPFALITEEDRKRLPPDIEDAYPLAKLQLGMVYHNERAPEASVYHDVLSLHVDAGVELGNVRDALDRLVAAHPMLRTSFDFTSYSGPLQLVHRTAAIPLVVEDFSSLSTVEHEVALSARIETDRRRSFDLASAPLLRVYLHRRGDHTLDLTLSFHHAILDGWSLASLTTELLKAMSGVAPRAAPASLYRDFIALERKSLACEETQRFWAELLEGATLLALPSARGEAKGADRRVVEVPIPAETSRALKKLAVEAGAPLKSVLLAAHLRVMSTISGESDVLTGVVANGRPERLDAERSLGLYLNTLPFRLQVLAGSWIDLVRQTFALERSLISHRRYPLAEMQRLHGGPLFDTAFNFTHFHVYEEAGAAQVLGHRLFEATNFKLVANFMLDFRRPSEVRLELTVRAPDLSDVQVEEIAGYYERALTEMAREPAADFVATSLLSPHERHRLLEEWNARRAPVPGGCIHERFEAQVERRSEAVAVVCGSEQLTYRELDERANRLAHHLRACGAGIEVPVALLLDRSVATAVAILGVLKAGCAYVPIEPGNPPERIAFLLADTGAPVLITEARHAEKARGYAGAIVRLDDDRATIERQPASKPVSQTTSESCAYVIYTSGSTGNPKGVRVSHGNVVRLFTATEEWFHFGERDVWTLFHSYAFDFSVWELWGALLYGGRVVVVPYDVSRSPEAFHALLARERVTVLNQTPSAFRLLVDADAKAKATELSLRLVIFGGEAIDLPSLRPWFERHGDERPRLVNMYGITETTVHVTYRPLRAADLTGSPSPIGRPIPDLEVYVVDRNRQLVPIGVPGELYVGGAGVALGYLNRPELTAERFVADPFKPGEQLYRTGDLGRWLGDGTLEYLGRCDQQVKIRGFRIELGEIESVLQEHADVREAVVVAREDQRGDKRLVAYVVPETKSGIASELRAYLERRLPEHMIPSAFVELPAIPLTVNGKVDRKALPPPGDARPGLEREYAAARSIEEELLAGIWAEVLGLERVGIDDDFFELGGDSILSIQVVARAQRAGLNLSVGSLFERRTIRGLLQAPDGTVEETREGEAFALIAKEDRKRLPPDVEDAYPLARLQLGMVFHNERAPEASIYHDVLSLHVEAEAEPEKLRDALDRLAAAHPILRTSFDFTRYSEPLQLVHRAATVPLLVEDFSSLSAEEQEEALTARAETDRSRPFDLGSAPLLRVYLDRRSGGTHQLTLSFHHAILDGWSLASLTTELLKAISGIALRDRPVSVYRDFIALERGSLASEQTRRFWAELLDGATLPALPSARGEPRGADRRVVEVPISPQTSRALKRLAIEAGAPLKSVLLAAHLRVMSIATGETDVVTGLVANGRPERQDADRSLGLYLNTLPFRLRLVPGSWIELVRRTFAVERGLIPHRRYPLAEMQRLHGGTLLETAFNFTHFHVFEEAGAGARVLSRRMFEATDFKLAANFMLDVPTRAVRLELTVADPQLSDAQVEEIAGYYERALIEMAREPAADCVATSLLSPGERRRLLAEWNATESAFPAGCIHELFEREAARCPEAMAVVCGTDRLTYRELDERSNQLARHLRDLGVAPEVRVGLCVNRSVEMVVGMLGVLKAGGAYVPLEPGHPPERLAFLLANAAAPVLLTQHRLTSKTSAYQGRTVCLDTQWEQISARSSARLSSTANSRNCAYVVYTSGSTGTPKGVVVEHGGLVNVADWHVRTFAVGPQVRMTQLASLGFDMAAWDIWSALIAGACLVVADDDTRAIPERLVEWLTEQRIVNAFLPTPLAEAVLELTWPSDTTLRVLQTAGDRLHRHPRAGLPFEVFNLYGPTEATLVATNVRLEPGLPGEPSIGRPIANTRTYVLDGNGELLPVGVVGELCIGGVGVARGYLDRPVLTAERFVPDPFHPEGRLYRTGDRCRWLADGTLQYIGRSDHQVKIRGVRIEPGEIEVALAAHSAVREAVVVAREDAPGDKRLVAYLVPRADVAFSMRELRKHLESKLPEAMIPAAFVEMNALPLTANGKIDRKALPRPEAPRKTFDSGSAFDPLEIEILRMWQDVLGVTEIGTREEFFALGGHSLLAVRLLKLIEDRFRRRVPLSIFLRSPTVEGLAAGLRGQASQMPWSPLVPIRSQGSRLPFFCVHPGLGNIAGYDTLARYLATDQPFYALCSIGLESDQEPDTRVEDMAARYVEAVRAVQPEGPYWLGGHSFGGLVAFEMARQLADQGERIDLLALFDTAAPGSFPGAESDRDALAIFLLFQEAALEVDYEYLRRFAPEKQLQSYFEAMVRAGQIPRGYDLEQVRRMVDWRTRIVPGAYRSYQPRFYPGRVTILRASEDLPPPPGVVDPGRGLEPVQRWKSAPVASATFHDVPGNHFTMIKQPHVRALAERLRGCLAEVDNAIPSKGGFANYRSPDHEESIAR